MKQFKNYSEEEINYIINNFQNSTNKQIAEYLGKSTSSITYVANKLKLVKQPHKQWTQKDIDYLKEHYLEMSSEELSKKLGCTINAVNSKCTLYGLYKSTPWIDEEEQFLLDNYLKMTHAEMGKYLHRTEQAIRAKCFELNLYKKERPWTEEEDRFLKKNYKEYSNAELSELLDRSYEAIHNRGSKLGLKKSPYFCNYHFFDCIDNEEKAYWLGFIIADGWLNLNTETNSGTVGIELQYKDLNHLKKFNKSLDGNYKITDRWRKCNISQHETESHNCIIRIYSTIMYQSLANLGLNENKSYEAFFPKIRNDLYRHMIRGYFDGDGRFCLSNKNFGVAFVTASKRLKDGLLDITRKQGIEIKDYSTNTGYSRTMYVPEITNNKNRLLFLDWIYKDSNIYLDRKYKKYLKAKDKYGTRDCLAS